VVVVHALRDRPRALVGGHPLATYFALTFALSWSYWLVDIGAGGTWSHFPGLLGPALAGLAITWRQGPVAHRAWMDRVTRWRVPLRWYAAAGIPVAVAAVVLAVRAVGFGDEPEPGLSRMPGLPDVGWFGVAALVLVVNGFGEEAGWRGCAWPLLRARHSLSRAAFVLAVPWALWHLPLFWIDTGLGDLPPELLPGFFFSLGCGSIVLGWLVERSGSVPVVAVWHTMLNMASATAATAVAAPFVSTAVIVWAIWIARRSS
jgi:membrane protease YdiL (CAAX protease family)